LHASSSTPVVVGFGIATPEQAAEVAQFADGVVVGSALVDLISKNRNAPDLEAQVEQYMRSMKEPLLTQAR
jgi:tryptophan synthase alpha chain